MCGISGIYQNKVTIGKGRIKKAVEAMNRAQVCRGPDDEGIFIYPEEGQKSVSIGMGHRRLSIIDLSRAGHQPMKFGNIWITFNGEIYNFLELKEKLEAKKYKFKTKSDTEVILALYIEYGEASFSMLRGMFAFALWDSHKQKLFLVKDRYGIKPLYYYSDSGKLIFASTVKALAKSGLIPIENNSKALIGFLLFGSVPLPMTTIKSVLAIPAGYYLIREADGQQKLIQYYDSSLAFKNKLIKISFEEAIQKVRSLLEESVKLHLISDAPLGIFLSGGLDSSVLAALSALQRKKPITTLSVNFEEEEFSEKKYQDLVSKKIKSDHREIKITAKDFFYSFSSIFKAMDQPTIDGVNTFFIAKAAKEAGFKVVLSGLGSDEIFCGYPSFKKAEIIRKIQRLPRFLKTPIGLASLFNSRYAKLTYFKAVDSLSFYLGIRGLFTPQETAKILDTDLSEVKNFLIESYQDLYQLEYSNIKTLEHLHPVDLLSYMELKFYLQNQLLKDTDFMSMYHSVEVRVPFLDHLLVEYLSSLPSTIKLDKVINKPLLVESVRDLLPQEILERKKMGFTFPFEKWLKGLLPSLTTSDLINKFKSGKLHWSRLWALYIIKQFKI